MDTGSMQNRPYQISYNDQSDIISLTYTGYITFQDKLSAIDELVEQFGSSKVLKILIDFCDATIRLNLDEQLQFGRYLAKKLSVKNTRAAALHPPNANPCCILNTTAFGQGLKIAEFDNVRDAVSWLS